MKPPMPEIGDHPNAISPLAMAFHDHVAVAARMASSTNVLTVVPCTVIVVLRRAP